MVAGGFAPQAAHRRPGVAGRLVLVLVVNVAHAFRLGAGALVLGALVFLVECLAASLALRRLGDFVQAGCGARLLNCLCNRGILGDGLLLELLGHATHLPSSAIPR